MNNSRIALDNVETLSENQDIDRKPWLRQRESELIKVIECLRKTSVSEEWSTLKSLIFEGVVEKLEKDILIEAKKDNPDVQKLASLNGQYVWAKKYADLDSLAQAFKVELLGIQKQLQ